MNEIIPVKLTPVLDTGAYTAGDVLFATTAIPTAIKSGIIRGVTIVDKDDVGESCDLWFFQSNVALGTANLAPSISDVNAEEIVGVLSAIAANKDLGGCRVGTYEFELPYDFRSGGGLYVAGVTNGALTHTASGVVFALRIQRENT